MKQQVTLVAAVFISAGLIARGGGPTPAAGNVTGKIKFTGAAPANPKIDMSEEAACKGKYTSDPVVAVSNGMLAGALVYVKRGLAAGQKFPVPSAPTVIDQE